MIDTLFMGTRASRTDALESKIKVSTVIHEAGHILMGRLHGNVRFTTLPRIITRDGMDDIEVNAKTGVVGIARTPGPMTDFCFGGYTAELVFLSSTLIGNDDQPFYANTLRATNDCIALVPVIFYGQQKLIDFINDNLLRHDRKTIEMITYLFNEGANRPESARRVTYPRMLMMRDQLRNIASSIYRRWETNNFRATNIEF